LSELAHQLLEAAADDISGVTTDAVSAASLVGDAGADDHRCD
jgi:hypothetical protein